MDTFVAHITVTDIDSSSPNNDVICELNSSSYSLNTLRDTEYIITVNSDLDREVSGSNSRSTSSHSVTVTCTDQGYPPLATQATVMVCNYVCIFGTAEKLFVTEQHLLLCPQYILSTGQPIIHVGDIFLHNHNLNYPSQSQSIRSSLDLPT